MIKNIKDIQPKEQKWLANAIASIIMIDDSLKNTQIKFIKQLFIVFLGEEPSDLLSEISAIVKKGIKPNLDKIEITDPNKLIFILDMLSASVFVNGKRMHLETERYFDIGKKLGFRIGILSYRLSLEVEKERVKRKLSLLNNDIRKELNG